MANISIDTGETLVLGTPSDDTVSMGRDLLWGTDTFDGNGGNDELIVTETLLDVTTFSASISYNSVDKTWLADLDGDTTGTTTDQVSGSNGFSAFEFSDGVKLVGDEANSGVVNSDGGTDLAFDARASLVAYDWDGNDLTAALTSTATLVSVDGTAVTNDSIISNADGQFTVDSTGSSVLFNPNSAAVSVQGNVGDTASFSYDVVVDIDGVETTFTVDFIQTITFTTGDDTWVGTDLDDTINTDFDNGDSGTGSSGFGGGNDSLKGGEGDDDLFGNDGNDTLKGENGTDDLYGGDGDDFIRGGNGIDFINGDAGADNLGGGAGDDFIYGGDDNDTITGGNGNDYIYGDGGDNQLNGGNGNDYIFEIGRAHV